MSDIPNNREMYLNGQCYSFAIILRELFPGGELWYSDFEGHMYYKYEKCFFDIRGVHYKKPNGIRKYLFDGDPAYRWGSRDNRILT